MLLQALTYFTCKNCLPTLNNYFKWNVAILRINIFYSILNAHYKITLVLSITCLIILWEMNKTNTKCGTNVASNSTKKGNFKKITSKVIVATVIQNLYSCLFILTWIINFSNINDLDFYILMLNHCGIKSWKDVVDL